MEIELFNLGLFNAIQIESVGGGAGAGKATFKEFSFRKPVNVATPAFFHTSAVGGHYKRAEVTLRQAGTTKPSPFYSVILDMVFVTSVDWFGSGGDDTPRESVAASFAAGQWSFTKFDAKGVPETTVTVNWNQLTNEGGDGPLPNETFETPILSYAAAHSVTSGQGKTITPTAGPSVPDGIASVTVKSAGGYTGNISVNNSGVVQLSNAQPVGGPYTIVIRAVSNHQIATEAGFNLTVDEGIPTLTAGADTVTRTLGRSLKFGASTLVANDSAGAVFDGLPNATTTLGGKVSLSGATIIYDPPTPDPGSNDSFTYRIRDSFNQTATGTVTVNVGGPNGGPSGNLLIRVTEAGTDLELAGIPGRIYQLQTASAVTGPWTNLGGAVTADANGSAKWTDPNPDTPRFYRAYNTP